MAVPETPITRLEKYWAAILDKIQGGGSVTVEALNVTENDTYTAPTGKAYSPVTVAVPNPNSVVTVTGTVAEPFGSIDPAELHTAITSNNATALMKIDATAIGVSYTLHLFAQPADSAFLNFQAVGAMNAAGCSCADASYSKTTGELYGVAALTQGVYSLLTDSAALLTTTLTVIHHPLPTE